MFRIALVALLLAAALSSMAQTAKKHFKTAQSFVEAGQYNTAIAELSAAINSNNSYIDAITLRAYLYEQLGSFAPAADDYSMASKLNPLDANLLVKAGVNYYKTNQFQLAIMHLSDALLIDKQNNTAIIYKALTLNKLYEYQQTLTVIEPVIAQLPNALAYYACAVASDSLKQYPKAANYYQKAIGADSVFYNPYPPYVRVLLQMGNPQEALKIASNAIAKFDNPIEVYRLRSAIYKQLNNLPLAINDLSKLETLLTDINEILLTRGQYYFDFGQYMNAKSDFDRLINITPEISAYYWRARANEELMETPEAILDYQTFLRLSGTYNTSLVVDARTRLFQLNRETDKPVIIIDTPVIAPDSTIVASPNQPLQIIGRTFDESGVQSLTINGENVVIDANGRFDFSPTSYPDSVVTITAHDVYQNSTELVLEVIVAHGE